MLGRAYRDTPGPTVYKGRNLAWFGQPPKSQKFVIKMKHKLVKTVGKWSH